MERRSRELREKVALQEKERRRELREKLQGPTRLRTELRHGRKIIHAGPLPPAKETPPAS